MTEKPRICTLSFHFHPVYAGAATQALRISKKLIEKGLKVFVVTAKLDDSPKQDVIEGVQVIRVPAFRRYDKARGPEWALRGVVTLLRRRKDYDIIHCHGPDSRFTLLGILVGKMLGKKTITEMTLVGADDPGAIAKSMGRMGLFLFSLSDIVVSKSTALSENYIAAGFLPCRLRKIPYGVNTNFFHPPKNKTEKLELRKRLALPLSEKIATFVGIIDKRKGVDQLVEAWRQVIDKYPDATLVLVGPLGREKNQTDQIFVQKLQQQIKDWKMEERVIFMGHVFNVHEYLMASDVFVFASHREGLPNAVLEAMACGLPCLTFNIPKISEDIITNGEDGIIIYDRNLQGFSEALFNLLSDEELAAKLGAKAREKSIKKFSIDAVRDQYLELYQEIIREKK